MASANEPTTRRCFFFAMRLEATSFLKFRAARFFDGGDLGPVGVSEAACLLSEIISLASAAGELGY